ncbi:MAG: hypothetical protein U0U66_12875 [Cytophagaceae bacterium]
MKKPLTFIFLLFLKVTLSYSQNERFEVKYSYVNNWPYHFNEGECVISSEYNEIPFSIFKNKYVIPTDSTKNIVINEESEEYQFINYKNQTYSYKIEYIWHIKGTPNQSMKVYSFASLSFNLKNLNRKGNEMIMEFENFVQEEDSLRFRFLDILNNEYEKYILQKLNIDLNIYHHLSNSKKVIICEEEYSMKDSLTLNTKYNSLKIRNIRVIDTLEKTVCEDLVSFVTNKSNLYSPVYVDCYIPNYKMIFKDAQDHVIAVINLQYQDNECSGYDYEVFITDKFAIKGSATIINGADFIKLLFSTFKQN